MQAVCFNMTKLRSVAIHRLVNTVH